jgi:hypothetical protein
MSSPDSTTVELTRAERRFLRVMVLRVVQDSAGLLRVIERERSPVMHREASENLELSAALLAKLPREQAEEK